MRKIAFIGATGMLGKPVVTALVDSGFQVSALVRKKETRFPEGVLPYLGDMRSREDLEGFLSGSAFKGHQVLDGGTPHGGATARFNGPAIGRFIMNGEFHVEGGLLQNQFGDACPWKRAHIETGDTGIGAAGTHREHTMRRGYDADGIAFIG